MKHNTDDWLKDILAELSIYSFRYGKGDIPMNENPPIIKERQAARAIRQALLERLETKTQTYTSRKEMYKSGMVLETVEAIPLDDVIKVIKESE